MDGLSATAWHVIEERGSNLIVGKREVVLGVVGLFDDQPELDGHAELLSQLPLGLLVLTPDVGENRRQNGKPEPPSEDPGVGQEITTVPGQLCETSLDEGLNRGGNHWATQACHHPGSVHQLQSVGLAVGTGELLNEEWDPFRAGMQTLHGLFVDGGTKHVLQELSRLHAGKPLQTQHVRDPHPIEVGDQLAGAGRLRVGTDRGQEKNRCRRQCAHEVADHLDAVLVGPLEVVEQQSDWAYPGDCRDSRCDFVEDAKHSFLRGQARHRCQTSR